MATYAGIDLHSSNNYIGVINSRDKRLYGKRHENNIKQVVKALSPFRKNLKGVVVESTYNWYWLVDGLQEAGFQSSPGQPGSHSAVHRAQIHRRQVGLILVGALAEAEAFKKRLHLPEGGTTCPGSAQKTINVCSTAHHADFKPSKHDHQASRYQLSGQLD